MSYLVRLTGDTWIRVRPFSASMTTFMRGMWRTAPLRQLDLILMRRSCLNDWCYSPSSLSCLIILHSGLLWFCLESLLLFKHTAFHQRPLSLAAATRRSAPSIGSRSVNEVDAFDLILTYSGSDTDVVLSLSLDPCRVSGGHMTRTTPPRDHRSSRATDQRELTAAAGIDPPADML